LKGRRADFPGLVTPAAFARRDPAARGFLPLSLHSGHRPEAEDLFTLGILILYRIGASIPSPGVNYPNVQKCIQQLSGGDSAQIYSLINLFSGGALLQLTVFAIGIMPYITASIIVQLLGVVIPRFEELRKEGQAGEINLHRYLTIALASAGDASWRWPPMAAAQGCTLDTSSGTASSR
jgi:preprotein translocase subunit SecY